MFMSVLEKCIILSWVSLTLLKEQTHFTSYSCWNLTGAIVTVSSGPGDVLVLLLVATNLK